MTDPIDRYMPSTGRHLKENGRTVNLADIAAEFRRSLTGLNAIETAETFPVIALKSNYGLTTLRDEVTTTGSGTVSNTVGDGRYTIATGTTAGSEATLDSVERGRYVSGTVAVPGLGVRIPQALEGDEVARWGYFNSTDGFGFGEDANGLFVFRRYQGTETVVRRADWDDPLDGTGISGDSMDPRTVEIYQMPYVWYGSGPIKFRISGSGTATDLVNCHTIRAPDGQPIVLDPNLQLRAEITNGTGTRDVTIEVYGRQFGILGRYAPNRRITGEFRLATTVGQPADDEFVPLVTFKQKSAYESVSVKTAGLDLIVTGNSIVYEIRVGATLTGAVYGNPSDIPATETALEFDTSATAMTGGQKIYSGLSAAGGGQTAGGKSSDIPDVDLPTNTPITLCARSVVTQNATVISVFRAREEW